MCNLQKAVDIRSSIGYNDLKFQTSVDFKNMNTPEVYTNRDDLDLIGRYRNGDQEACTALIARYANFINRRVANIGVAGVGKDDLKQEAYMGLFSAIRTYDPAKNSSFRAYAASCIGNSLKNLFAAASTQKAKIYSQTISFDEIGNDNLRDTDDATPEDIYIGNEAFGELQGLIDRLLTSYERDVLFYYLSGRDYKQVAAKLHSSQKSVDNALQRARRKLKAVLNDL